MNEQISAEETSQTTEYVCQGYQILNVYQNMPPHLKQEVVQLWLESKVLSPAVAGQRADQVLFTIRNPQGRLVGVNTVSLQNFLTEENPYYFMRLFIRREDRGVLGLQFSISKKAREFLERYPHPQSNPKGMIIVAENRKYWRKGARRLLARYHWHYFGQGPKGNHIWYQNFDGSKMTALK